jgi:hypothetical protein
MRIRATRLIAYSEGDVFNPGTSPAKEIVARSGALIISRSGAQIVGR